MGGDYGRNLLFVGASIVGTHLEILPVGGLLPDREHLTSRYINAELLTIVSIKVKVNSKFQVHPALNASDR